jgi:hypothetical protein
LKGKIFDEVKTTVHNAMEKLLSLPRTKFERVLSTDRNGGTSVYKMKEHTWKRI